MANGPLEETSLLVKPLWPQAELPNLGEEWKPFGSGESRRFSSWTGSGSCLQKVKVACETMPKHDQICHGFARSLPGLWKSHKVPGKGPALEGLTACAPPTPAASSRPRKQELLVFPVIDPSTVAWTSVCPVHVVSQ